ncbi:MAG: UMP kinase [Halobacteriota archaeon]
MRVVISLGGSVVFDDRSAETVEAHAAAIEELVDAGHELAVVVGGGPVAREYIAAGRELGADEVRLDEIGIGVTRLNARLLIQALGDRAHPWPVTSYGEARQAMRRGDIPVLGGVAPAQTTDAVSAATAEHIDAHLLLYATSVDGVYSGDPAIDAEAERYRHLPVTELLQVIAEVEMSAGSKAPVDLLAAKIIQRSKLRTIVMDGTDPEAIARAVLTGDHDGTDIAVEGMERPPAW